MNYSNFKDIEHFLLSSKNIVLSTHTNPDGDTLGSALALFHFLKQKDVHAHLITPQLASENLRWLPGYDLFVPFDIQEQKAKDLIRQADLIVHIDYNSFHRTGNDVAAVLNQAKNAKHVIIDHHPKPDQGFDAYISNPSACATAQLVYELIGFSHKKINKDIATCLYLALMTDTGSFSYGMEDEKPYLMAADLVKNGANDRWIHQKVYSGNTLDRLRLIGYWIFC